MRETNAKETFFNGSAEEEPDCCITTVNRISVQEARECIMLITVSFYCQGSHTSRLCCYYYYYYYELYLRRCEGERERNFSFRCTLLIRALIIFLDKIHVVYFDSFSWNYSGKNTRWLVCLLRSLGSKRGFILNLYNFQDYSANAHARFEFQPFSRNSTSSVSP